MKLKALISAAAAAILVLAAQSAALDAAADDIDAELAAAGSFEKYEPAASGASDEIPAEIVDFYDGTNINDQNYVYILRWTTTIDSYLTECSDGTILRFQNKGSGSDYLAEYYDSSYECLSRRLIPRELDLFGGFYSSDKYYFIISGQKNYEESDSTEVVRITKYDKNWNRLSSAGLYGANTVEPFQAGSLRADTCGSYLILRTAHKMYASSDGNNHQANLTIEYNMNTSQITDYYADVMNSRLGYISHSFNQFIKIENNKIAALDHGDAHPRSIVLVKYKTDVSNGKFVPDYFDSPCDTLDVVSMPGESGENDTGMSVGGFEISDTHYITAGNIVVDSSDYQNYRAARNVFVAAVDKSTNAVKMNYLTSYSTSEKGAVNPHLARIGNNRFIVMWTTADDLKKVYYTEIDGSGSRVSSIYTMDASLSDCPPTVINGELTWYVWDYVNVNFYHINVNNIADTHTDQASIYSPVVNLSYIDSNTVLSGDYLYMNAVGSGGNRSYVYSYYLKKENSSSWMVSRENVTYSGLGATLSSVGRYEAVISVTDTVSGERADKTFYVDVVTPPALENRSTLSKTTMYAGDTVTINGAAAGGYSNYTYAFYYKKHTGSEWYLKGEEYSGVSSAELKLNYAVPYDIKVIVKDRKGNTASKEMTLTVKPALANTSSVRSTSIKLGDPINITGSASGGSGSYKYSYYFKQASKSGWTTKTANTSSSSVSITPSLAVDYNIKVTVTDSTGKTASKTFTVKVNPTAIVNNSAVQSTSIMLGSTINVSTSASGGNGSYKYSYYFKQAANSSWTTKAANTAAKTVTIKPSQAVDYNVKVVVLDTDGRSASKIFTVKVNTPPLKNKSSVKSAAIKLGNTIDITAAAEGGSGSYKYSYYFKQASGSAWTAKSTNTTAASVSIKPSKAVSYNVKVVVTDSKGTTSTKTFMVSVTKSTLANNSSAASSSIKLGNTINITASASGGAKPYKYSYYFKQAANSGWIAKATNTTASSISIKPSQAVDYNIKVVVTDAEGAVSEKTFTVKVTK